MPTSTIRRRPRLRKRQAPPGQRGECDDGTTRAANGCQANCRLEPGYNCDPNGGACMPSADDSLVAGGETCDDGLTVAEMAAIRAAR